MGQSDDGDANAFPDLDLLIEHLKMIAKQESFGGKHGPAFSGRMRQAHSIISRESEILETSLAEMRTEGLDSEHVSRSVYALLIAALNIGGAHSISEAAVDHLKNLAPRKARSDKAARDLARIEIQKQVIAEFIEGKNVSAPTAFVRRHLEAINAAARRHDVDPGGNAGRRGMTYTASQNTWIERLKAVLSASDKNQH